MNSSENKPFKGEIWGWVKHHVPEENWKLMPDVNPGLGYYIVGRRPSGQPFHTSMVVSHDEISGQIETLNSRYILISEQRT